MGQRQLFLSFSVNAMCVRATYKGVMNKRVKKPRYKKRQKTKGKRMTRNPLNQFVDSEDRQILNRFTFLSFCYIADSDRISEDV